MKKIYLIILCLATFKTYAQTLMQADLPFAGLVWTSGVDTNYADPIPPGGSAQNWDFSNLQYSYIDTSGFQDAAGTPYASTFPNAILASHKAGTGDWSYFNSSPTGFYINGFASPTLTAVINPQQMYVPVPFSFGDQHTDISRVVIDTVYLTFNAQVILNFHADFHADGYGSLITPTATYPGTLRVRETMLETDSLMLDYLGNGNYTYFGSQQSQKNYFRWFQHGGTANYILGIDADSLGNFATRSDYVIQWAVLGTNEITTENSLSVFPNPANEKLTIDFGNSSITSLEIYNMLGEKVISKTQKYSSNPSLMLTSQMSFDITNQAAGIYFYSALSGEKLLQGRFSVVH